METRQEAGAGGTFDKSRAVNKRASKGGSQDLERCQC